MTALTLIALAAPLAWRGGRGWALTLAIAALAGGWSAHRLALPEPAPQSGIVRIVQPNITQSLKWDPAEAQKNFDILRGLSQESSADLILWPETALPWLLDEEGVLAGALGRIAGAARLATGYQRNEGDKAWNALSVFNGAGEIEQTFDKNHLVPFGEYIPMGDLLYDWFGLQAFASQAGAGYSAGESRARFDLGPRLGKALPLICYEGIFPEELRDPAQGGARADWLLQVTNDAWFGTLTGPYQHFNQTRLRAIEAGLPLLRAANTGISAVVDARGRVVASLGLAEQGVIDHAVPGPLGQTPYGRTGDWPLTIGLLLLLVVALATKPRAALSRGGVQG